MQTELAKRLCFVEYKENVRITNEILRSTTKILSYYKSLFPRKLMFAQNFFVGFYKGVSMEYVSGVQGCHNNLAFLVCTTQGDRRRFVTGLANLTSRAVGNRELAGHPLHLPHPFSRSLGPLYTGGLGVLLVRKEVMWKGVYYLWASCVYYVLLRAHSNLS